MTYQPPYGLFSAEIWFICKYLIKTITIFSLFNLNHFLKSHFLSIIIICLYTVIWYLVFLSNTNNFYAEVINSAYTKGQTEMSRFFIQE